MMPFVPVLVLAASALLCPALEQNLADQVSLLQAELEKAKAPKAKASELLEDDEPPEPICQQLAGKDGSCERLVPQPADLLRVAPQEESKAKMQAPSVEQPHPQTERPAKSTGSSILGYILDVLVVALALDGLRRWHQAKAEPASEAEGFDSLMKAALAGDAAGCEALLSKQVSIMGSDLWGCTALHAASKGGSVPVVRKLLERGARTDEPDSWDEMPLHVAARAGHGAVCEALLERGAPADAANAQEWTPLVVAADAGHQAVCRLLMGKGATAGNLTGEALPTLLAELLAEAAPSPTDQEELEEESDLMARTEEYWRQEELAESCQ
mmetsp:Transcript_123857/g.361660  ORF Transcript_123857/g.361660 Transcript_123857/m.361660 type:complete len:327 (+) Transcript_123857:109-1089(+)